MGIHAEQFYHDPRPSKPRPDFPLFPHASGRWAKKIRGKFHYFGSVADDPSGRTAFALWQKEKDRLLAGPNLRRPKRRLPTHAGVTKPRPDFPLFPHQTGRWAKKVKGNLLYFGKVANDPKGEKALAAWLTEKDYCLLHGRRQPTAGAGLTVADLCNRVLNVKRLKVDDGELTLHTFRTWTRICRQVVTQFGGKRLVEDLGPDDFEALLRATISGRAASSRSVAISFVRSLFRFACNENQRLISAPVLFGEAFQPPRLSRIKMDRGPGRSKLFTAEQLQEILAFVKRPMKAMVLLGINCGLGNHDIASLTFDHLDLEAGWHNHPRPKTGTARRCPLWPETIEAIEHALKIRPRPKNPAHKELVFLTRNGLPYVRLSAASATAFEENKTEDIQHENIITTNMWAVLKRLGMKRDGLSFYALRHTFETIGGGAKDQVAVDFIMGHVTPGMGTTYRQAIDDERLQAVVDHVHGWLWPVAKTVKPK